MYFGECNHLDVNTFASQRLCSLANRFTTFFFTYKDKFMCDFVKTIDA